MPEQDMARKSSPISFWKITNDMHVVRHYTEQQQPNDGFSDSESSSDENEAHVSGNTSSQTDITENGTNVQSENKESCDRNNISDHKHLTEEIINCYDASVYKPITAGQSADDVDVPIMSPPIVEEPKRSWDLAAAENYQKTIPIDFETRLRFARTLAFKVDETCNFGNIKTADVLKAATFPVGKRPTCLCNSYHGNEEFLCSWKSPCKSNKAKAKKRWNTAGRASSAFVHGKTQTTAVIPDKRHGEQFRHYKNTSRYIDQYRQSHTVGNVCRRARESQHQDHSSKQSKGGYHSRLRPEHCVAIPDSNEVLANLSGSDDDSNEVSFESSNLWNSDDGSNEESSGNDSRTLSMRDRGKTLNLAPVRECAVPDISQMQTDNYDQFQEHFLTINQYLNLMTPPYPANKIRQSNNETQRRNRSQTVQSRGTYLFPACAPRRGARPLRLGSAEFIKPGVKEKHGDTENKWSGNESRPLLQRSATYHSGLPIQGSDKVKTSDTGTQLPQQQSPTPGRNSTTPPNQASGMKPCDRVCELTNGANGRQDRQRFKYTHAANVEQEDVVKIVPSLRSTYVENYAAKKDRMLSVNVNELGIRGKMFKADDRLNLLLRFEKEKRHIPTLLS